MGRLQSDESIRFVHWGSTIRATVFAQLFKGKHTTLLRLLGFLLHFVRRVEAGIATVNLGPANSDRSETTSSSGLGEVIIQPPGSWRLALPDRQPRLGLLNFQFDSHA